MDSGLQSPNVDRHTIALELLEGGSMLLQHVMVVAFEEVKEKEGEEEENESCPELFETSRARVVG